MLDWTDRHARYFFRLFSDNLLLYTEMVTTGAIIYGDRTRFLKFHPTEHPLALQLGGSDPDALEQCAQLGEAAGFDEINLNIGCPSDRVQAGRFGACLMAEPQLVADCVVRMRDTVNIPVTVKCRIGIDDNDSYAFFKTFVDTVANGGCTTFAIHARKAWLKGLSPKQNREIPPLVHDTVYRLKDERPDLTVIVNGGIRNMDQVEEHLEYVDGVMLGREVFQNPSILLDVDRRIFDQVTPVRTREDILALYLKYVDEELDCGTRLKELVPPLFGLFQGCAGARAWRRYISENAYRQDAGIEVLYDAASRAFDLQLAA